MRASRAVRTFLALADTSRRALACRAMCQPLAAPVQTFVAARALASRRCVKWRSTLLLHARAPLLLFVILLAPRPAKTRETKHASDEVQVVRNRYHFRSGWRNEGMRKKVLKSRALQHFMLAVPPADVTQVAGPKSSVRPDPGGGGGGRSSGWPHPRGHTDRPTGPPGERLTSDFLGM